VSISVTRWDVVTDAGIFWTVTRGAGLPTGTGISNRAGPTDITQDDVYSCKLGTCTVAVLHIHCDTRTDSGTAPGFVLSILEAPPLGVQQGAVKRGRRGRGQELYLVYMSLKLFIEFILNYSLAI
jgi:hypothetical protein